MGISADWTLANARAQVRAQSSTISKQTSGVLDKQLNDLFHASLVIVRSTLDKLVDDYYKVVSGTLAFSAASSGLSALTTPLSAAARPYDMRVSKNSLFDTTYKEIPLYNKMEFDARRTVISVSDLGLTGAIGTIYMTTSGTVQIDTYVGNTAPAGCVLTYLRPPTKETTDTNTVDLPDRWVPLAIDHCTQALFRRVGKAAPADVEQRVQTNASVIAQMLNANVD